MAILQKTGFFNVKPSNGNNTKNYCMLKNLLFNM